MSRLTPLPWHKLVCVFQQLGYRQAGQKGSHVKFVRRSGKIVDTAIVPKKPEIPIGTLRSILSQAHVSRDEWDGVA